MKNKILYGIEKCYISKITEENGQISYGTPFEMPGVTGFRPEPQGETTPFYADNVKYFIANSNQGYEGELTLAIAPEDFLTQILGQTKDINGALIENADDKTARFAFMFQGKGDQTESRYVYYDCTATRPSREHNTQEESIEVATDSITITMSPRSTDRAIKAVIEPTDENKTIYDTFFTKVYEKDAVLEETNDSSDTDSTEEGV